MHPNDRETDEPGELMNHIKKKPRTRRGQKLETEEK
jgi:hypothetical protein